MHRMENKHQAAWKLLHKTTDITYYNKISDEQGMQTYKNTISVWYMAPERVCKGVTYKFQPHAYICDASETLQHGKNSPLLHELGCASKLKHPQTVHSYTVWY